MDPKQEATKYPKDQIGSGTGDAAVDGRMVWAANQKADVMVAQKREVIAQTAESNTAQTITNDVPGKMLRQKGVTTGQTDAWHGQFLSLAKGNIQVADKMFEAALTGAILNDGHAQSTLAALRESGYAQRNPDSYDIAVREPIRCRRINRQPWADPSIYRGDFRGPLRRAATA